MDNRFYIFNYVFLLPNLLMKRNLESCQWLEDQSDIHLWPTCHTQINIQKFQIDSFFNEFQNILASGQRPREIGAFVKSIDNDILALVDLAYPPNIFSARQCRVSQCCDRCLNITWKGRNKNQIWQKTAKGWKRAGCNNLVS